MSHHSGLPREPMRGNYADKVETSLASTVDSLNQMSLVLDPNESYKYSNAAISLVGRVLEVVTGEPFGDHVQKMLDEVLEMPKTSFLPKPHLLRDLCNGYMWSYDDRREADAPMFEIGEAPAGSMFSTVKDMANFIVCLLNRGEYNGKTLIKEETLKEMWRPQYEDVPMGLGFVSAKRNGVHMVGHGGAIYGYCAELVVAPELKVGIISMLGLDSCNPVLSDINNCGMYSLLPEQSLKMAREQNPSSHPPAYWINENLTVPIPRELFKTFEGLYVQAERLDDKLRMSHDDGITKDAPNTWVYFFATKYHLEVMHNHMRIRVRGIPRPDPIAPTKSAAGLAVLRVTPDDRLLCGQTDMIYYDIYYHEKTKAVDHIRFMGKTYKRSVETTFTPRMTRRRVNHETTHLEPYVGEYGPPHNPTFVFIREGQLIVQIEWFCLSVVEKVSDNLFKFEDDSLYSHETIRFERDGKDPKSPATAIVLADHIRFPRVAPRLYTSYEEVPTGINS